MLRQTDGIKKIMAVIRSLSLNSESKQRSQSKKWQVGEFDWFGGGTKNRFVRM